jgi:hypothetical protein
MYGDAQLQQPPCGDRTPSAFRGTPGVSVRETRLARLSARGWREYLTGWTSLVASGYAPPGFARDRYRRR